MSRNHSMAMRGMSNDSRIKTKTKKAKNCQERKLDQPQLKSAQSIEQRNIDILLNIAYHLSEIGHKYPEHRLKLCDARTLDLLTKQLKAMKEAENHEKYSNRIKAKQMRDYAENMRERKQYEINEAESALIMKSRSPKRIFFAEQIGSPKPKRQDYGLIERKIQQDQNKAMFANIRKKEQIFGRLLQNIDKIAEKLSVETSNREQGFKGYITKISSSITAIINRQSEQANIMNENKQLKDTIGKLEEQIKSNIQQSNKSEFEMKLSHEQKIKQIQNKLKDLEQEFSMLTLEKLTVQKQLSTSKKLFENMKYKTQERLKEIKYQVQQQLNEQMEQIKNQRNRLSIQIKQLVCFSKQITNKIISQYTKLLHNAFLEEERLRKQNSTLFHQKNEIFQSSKIQNQKVRGYFKQQYKLKQARRRQNNQIQSVLQYNFKQNKPQINKANFKITEQASIIYEPSKKEDKFTQSIFSPKTIANVHNIKFEGNKAIKNLIMCSSNIQVKYFLTKESIQIQTQNSQQIIQQLTVGCESQTFSAAFQSTQIQTNILEVDLIKQTNKRLDYASDIISEAHIFKKQLSTSFSQTDQKNLCLSGQLSSLIFVSHPAPIFKIDVNTNTQHSVLHMLSPVRNFPQEYLDFASSNKKQEYKSQNPIIDLLLQAQECILVPQISALKEQILHYQQQIASLNTMIQTLKEKQQKQQQNVFQFCF